MPALLEIERLLEGISEKTPRCQCLWKRLACRNPGYWQILSACPHCHHREVAFVCNRCHEDAVLHGFECGFCYGVRGIDRYL